MAVLFGIQVSGLTGNNDEHEKGSIVGGFGVHLDSKRVVRKCGASGNLSNAYVGHGTTAGAVWCRVLNPDDRHRHFDTIRSRIGRMALAPYVRRWSVVIRIATNVGACRSAPVRWACVEGRILASVCCTPPFHSLNR